MRLPVTVASALAVAAALGVAVAAGVAAGPAGSAAGALPAAPQDDEAIQALVSRIESCYDAGDVDCLMGLYGDDAMALQPGQPAIVGPEAMRAAAEEAFAGATYDLSLTTEEVVVPGDWAFARGSYTILITPTGEGDAVEDRGKWLLILERQDDGSWAISRSIRNSDLTPGA